MHEKSDTIQDKDGNWINVYGSGFLNSGQVLPIKYPHFERDWYDTRQEAEQAAMMRSQLDYSLADEEIEFYDERTPPDWWKVIPGVEEEGDWALYDQDLTSYLTDHQIHLLNKPLPDKPLIGMLKTSKPVKDEGRRKPVKIKNLRGEKPGYSMAEGSNFWSVNEKDSYWQTKQGYEEAMNLYGTKPGWVKEPSLEYNPTTGEYDSTKKEEFVDLKPTKKDKFIDGRQ